MDVDKKHGPLVLEKKHFLHPDTSQVFPIILDRVSLNMKKSAKDANGRFSTNGKIIKSLEKEIYIDYPGKDIYGEGYLP